MNFDRRDLLILVLCAALAACLIILWRSPTRAEFVRLRAEVAGLRDQLRDEGQRGVRLSMQPPAVSISGAEGGAFAPAAERDAPLTLAAMAPPAVPPELDDAELGRLMGGAFIADPLGGAIVAGAAAAAGATAGTAVPEGPKDDPQAEEQTLEVVKKVEEGGILLPAGVFQFEPAVTYSHISSNSVGLSGLSIFDVIFVGEILSEEIDRDIVVFSNSLRAGLGHNLEVGVSVPVQYMYEEVLSGPVEERVSESNHRAGLNEVQANVFWQFMNEDYHRPALIASLGVKAPTGHQPRFTNGAWGVRGGLLFVKTSDPVVIFGNAGYFYQFETDLRGEDYKPGNSIEYALGLAYALNYNVSINGSFEHLFIGETEQANQAIAGSRLVVANFKTGLTWVLTRNLSMDVSVGTGLTEDSPDFTITVSVPYTF